jgi:hypothetical protein
LALEEVEKVDLDRNFDFDLGYKFGIAVEIDP